MLLIEVAAVLRYFCFKQFFVPTCEESEGIMTRGEVFFHSVTLKNIPFVQAFLAEIR